MANLSKCFFQVSFPENQRDLFNLVWFRNKTALTAEIFSNFSSPASEIFSYQAFPYLLRHDFKLLPDLLIEIQ